MGVFVEGPDGSVVVGGSRKLSKDLVGPKGMSEGDEGVFHGEKKWSEAEDANEN